MQGQNLKVGDHLYELCFWDGAESKREMRQYTIAKISRGRIKLMYWQWTLALDKYGIDYFSTKQEAIKDSIKTHKNVLTMGYYKRHKLDDYDKKEMNKSIKSLERYLNKLDNNR